MTILKNSLEATKEERAMERRGVDRASGGDGIQATQDLAAAVPPLPEAFASAPAPPEKTRNFLTIDWAAMQVNGMLTPEMARSQMAEEYRLIKRPLLMNAFPDGDNGIEHANLILVTSSVPGEGKTFTAANLALSIAMERDKWVLLVDADVAKPSISKLLGIRPQAGLIDLLIGSGLKLSDTLVKTDIPNFSILPAGTLHQYSTELLASDAMKRLAKELSARYPDRIVIFDSPPLLAATQAPVLANLVGQVVLVVESEVTPQYIVRESVSKLENCKVVGCVLNKTKKGFGFTYYGLGYGYGYGYYGQAQRPG
ncbi:MAG: XrtA-associated tyrosine autokinase [Candidatus Methylumidiphilus sp.]